MDLGDARNEPRLQLSFPPRLLLTESFQLRSLLFIKLGDLFPSLKVHTSLFAYIVLAATVGTLGASAPEPAVVARRIPFESFNSFSTGGNGGGSKSGDGGISIGTLTRRLQIRACILI